MSIVQSIFVVVALSGPVAILVGVVLAALCFARSRRAKNVRFALLSVLGALTLLALLAVIIVVWFAYGVAHTGKDATTDLTVLAVTVIPAYIGAFAAWKFSAYLRKKFSPEARPGGT